MTMYFVLVGVFFASLGFRSLYELLRKQGKIDPRNRIVFGLVFLDMCAMWASWSNLCPLDPWKTAFPEWLRWTGLVANALGWTLFLGGMVQLKGLENIDHLATSGLYAKIRHPMYCGFALWLVGWPLWNNSATSLLVGAAALAEIWLWRTAEEKRLETQYGTAWQEYRSKTWF